MRTDIPVGTVVKVRCHGEWEYARVFKEELNPDGTIRGGIRGFEPPPGDCFSLGTWDVSEDEKRTAVRAVWKEMGTRLVLGRKK